jgi:AraC-like DNA-binding protein
MLTQGYLSLRLNRVKAPVRWTSNGEGLAFIFPSGGAGRYVSVTNTQGLGPGDVLVINDAECGQLCPADAHEIVFWSFAVQLEHLYPLFANEEIRLLQDLQDRFKTSRFYSAATPVAAECHKLLAAAPPQFNLDHRTYLLRIASVVLSLELSNARPQKCGFVRIEDHLKAIFEQLSIDELLSLSVGDLARRFSCSRRHLNRLFHQHFGFSVASFRMEMRLLKAASLLRDPEAKVINVAEQCGFNHLGLFNTCFKRRFGSSPGQWRSQPALVANGRKAVMSADSTCRMRVNGLCPWSGDAENGKPCPMPAPGPVTSAAPCSVFPPKTPATVGRKTQRRSAIFG